MRLRVYEWIDLGAMVWFIALAWLRRPLDGARRAGITWIGIAGFAATLFAAAALPRFAPLAVSRAVRDWLPVLILSLFYWQGGLFITRTDYGAEKRLAQLDRRLLPRPLIWCARHTAGHWILAYLELAYMSYYAALPLAVATLYLVHVRQYADQFWTAVLLAAYGSCTTLPFLQTRPPRALPEKWSKVLPCCSVRRVNLWILDRGSIQANTCPSAHVAISTACALAMLRFEPVGVGLAFLWIAVSIACGAVAGRYHYATDAVLGFIVAAAAFLAALPLAPLTFGA